MSEELEVQAEPVEETKPPAIGRSITHWKPADEAFTDEDKAAIAECLGLTVDEVVWSEEDQEADGVVGHALIGATA